MKAREEQIQKFERSSTHVLGIGLAVSALCLAAGLALWAPGVDPPATQVLEVGLLVLIVTPAARVLVSLAEYLYVRDWFFVATTAAVVIVLLAGVISAVLTR